MAFGVNEFLSSLAKTGIAKQSLFEVVIHPPSNIVAGDGNTLPDARHLSMRVESVDIPGRTAQTIDYTTDFGPMRKIPYQAMYGDISTIIVLSADMRERLFFEAWQDKMLGYHRVDGPHKGRSFTAGYYSEYIGNLVIKTYDEKGDQTFLCSLEECYPAIINPMNSNWGSQDIHKLAITWYYRYFRDKRDTISYASEVNTGGFFAKSGLGALLGVGAGALAGKLGPAVGGAAITGIGILQGSARLNAVTKGR